MNSQERAATEDAPGQTHGPHAHVDVLEVSSPRDYEFLDFWYELNSEDHFWFAWRARVLQRILQRHRLRNAELRALDVGCGTGVVRRQIEGMTNWVIDGTDLDRRALERATGGRGTTMYYDIYDRHPDLVGRYDAVVLFDVLEHIENEASFLDALAAHLKHEGRLLINVPALMMLYSQYDRAQGHFRRYTRHSLQEVLTSSGFRVLEIRYLCCSLVPLLLLRKLWLRCRPLDDEAAIRRGFEPPGRLTHAVLRAAMHVETSLPLRYPMGTSVMALAERTSS
jgi:SAM-dependent methyltransferase